MPPIDLDDSESLRRAYVEEGRSLSAIADMAGCSYASVRRALLRNGIAIRRSGPAPIERLRDKQWLQAQVSEGLSAKDIATRLECAEGTVRSALHWAGVAAGPARERPSVLDDVTFLERAYVNDGRSVRSIAQEVGCTKDAVLAALRAHGVPIRGRGRVPTQVSEAAPEPNRGPPARQGDGDEWDSVVAAPEGRATALPVSDEQAPRAETPIAAVEAPRQDEVPDEAPPDSEPPGLAAPDPAEPPEPEPFPESPPPPNSPMAGSGNSAHAGATLASPGSTAQQTSPDRPITARPQLKDQNGATVTPSTPPLSRTDEQSNRSSRDHGSVPPPVEDKPAGRIDEEIAKIETRTFSISLRGYDRQEVDAFLRAVAKDYRQVIKSAREAVNAARAAAQAPAPPPPPAPEPPATSTFEEIGGRVTAVLTSASEAAEDIKASAEKDASAIRQRAREEAERLRRAAAEALAEAEQARAASDREAAEAAEAARAEAEQIVSAATQQAEQFEAEARERVMLRDRTVRANIDAVLAEARRDYEHLRSAQQQCIDRLASVEFLAKHARDGLSDNAGQPLDELL